MYVIPSNDIFQLVTAVIVFFYLLSPFVFVNGSILFDLHLTDSQFLYFAANYVRNPKMLVFRIEIAFTVQ